MSNPSLSEAAALPAVEIPSVGVEFAAVLDMARQGCRRSQGEVLQQCRQYLLAAAGKQLPPGVRGKIGGSDLVQETLTVALRRFERFAGNSEEELRAWLARILTYQSMTALRRFGDVQKRDVCREVSLDLVAARALLPTDTPSPSARAVSNEQYQQLEQAMSRLRPLERQVIELRNLQLLPFAEIGRQLERSSEAARKLWARAVACLTDELQGDNASRA